MHQMIVIACTLAVSLAQFPQGGPSTCAVILCQVGSTCQVMNGVARCVAPSTNPGAPRCSQSGQFEEFKQCASTFCEPKCTTRGLNLVCPPVCNLPGACVCRQGFFRDGNGRCVTENDCDSQVAQTCQRNEQFSQCSSNCEPKCGEPEPRACNFACGPPKCQCAQGFFRHSNGSCVRRNECGRQNDSRVCKRNERFMECSSMCEPKCGDRENMACIAMCGPAKCQCEQGFVRNENGDCVRRNECGRQNESRVCKRNERFMECSSMCEPKCGDGDNMACILMCGPPKCQCEQGLFRNENGICVRREECIRRTPCMSVRCGFGTRCVDTAAGPRCVR